MKFFSKKANLRRRIAGQGFLINRAQKSLEDWNYYARQSNNGARSVALQALIEHEYLEKQEKIEQQVVELDLLVKRYEET